MSVSIGVFPTNLTKNSCSITCELTVLSEGNLSSSLPNLVGWLGYCVLQYSSRAHWDFSCKDSICPTSLKPQASEIKKKKKRLNNWKNLRNMLEEINSPMGNKMWEVSTTIIYQKTLGKTNSRWGHETTIKQPCRKLQKHSHSLVATQAHALTNTYTHICLCVHKDYYMHRKLNQQSTLQMREHSLQRDDRQEPGHSLPHILQQR